MATKHNLYTIGTTAVPVSPTVTHSGMDITVQNVSPSGFIYVGGEGVTELNYGYRISPNHAISLELSGRCELYAVGSAAGLKAAVLITELEVGS